MPSVLCYLKELDPVSLHLPHIWPLTCPLTHQGLARDAPHGPWPHGPCSVTYHPPGNSACLTSVQLGPTHSGLSLSGENEDRVKKTEKKAISKVPLSVTFIRQRWGVAVSLSGRDKAKVWELRIFRGIHQEWTQNFALFHTFSEICSCSKQSAKISGQGWGRDCKITDMSGHLCKELPNQPREPLITNVLI